MAKRKAKTQVSAAPEYDPLDSAAESLAESALRKHPKFLKAKAALKEEATRLAKRVADGKVGF